MRSHPSTPLFIVTVTLASMLGVSPITGDEFTSGTHTVNSAIDGIFATGPNTVITIEESAIVQPIPDFPGFPTLRSLVAEDGARIIVNGGTFTNSIESQTNATIDINGGVFRNSVQPGSLMNIRGGIFNGQVLAGGEGQLNIYGGSFSSEISVGYDSSDGAEVNIFAKSFAFGEDLEALLAEDFPFDVPGKTISLTDETGSAFHEAIVIGEFVDGSLFDIRLFLDGPDTGYINLNVVPEPSAMILVAFAGIFLAIRRRSISG